MVTIWISGYIVLCCAVGITHAVVDISNTAVDRKKCSNNQTCGPSMYCDKSLLSAYVCRHCSFLFHRGTKQQECVSKRASINLGEAIYDELGRPALPVCDSTKLNPVGVNASCLIEETNEPNVFIGAVCTISCSDGYMKSPNFVSAAKCDRCTTIDEGCFWNVTLTNDMCVPITEPASKLSPSELATVIIACLVTVLVIVIAFACGIRKFRRINHRGHQVQQQPEIAVQETPRSVQRADPGQCAETDRLVIQTTTGGERTSSLDSDSGYSDNSQVQERRTSNPTVNFYQNSTTIQNIHYTENTLIANQIGQVVVREREARITEEIIESPDCDHSIILGDMTLSTSTEECKRIQNANSATRNERPDTQPHQSPPGSDKHIDQKIAAGARPREFVDSGYAGSQDTAYSQVDSTGSRRLTSSQQDSDPEFSDIIPPLRSVPFTTNDFQKPIPRPCNFSDECEAESDVGSTEATRGSECPQPQPRKPDTRTKPDIHDSFYSLWTDSDSQAQQSHESDLRIGPLISDNSYDLYTRPRCVPASHQSKEPAPQDPEYNHINQPQSPPNINFPVSQTTNMPYFPGLRVKAGTIGNVEYNLKTTFEASHADQVNMMLMSCANTQPRIVPVDLDVNHIDNLKSISHQVNKVVTPTQNI